jgi:nicotinamidase-related amidase
MAPVVQSMAWRGASVAPNIEETNVDTPIALLIIDMQQGMRHPELGPRNNPEAETRIAELLARWRQIGWPVVHIRHISRQAGSVFAPGKSGVLFQPAFEPLAAEQVFEKNVPDAFTHSGLERWLRVRGIERLALVGVITENSVEATARTAGNLGFVTRVVADACFTFAKADYSGRPRSAEEVHDMALANLHGEYAEVLDSRTLLQQVPQRD